MSSGPRPLLCTTIAVQIPTVALRGEAATSHARRLTKDIREVSEELLPSR